MLATGDMDDKVHPANTLRMADALIADYFCKHLLGDVAANVDMIELNKEREQSGDKGANRRGGR